MLLSHEVPIIRKFPKNELINLIGIYDVHFESILCMQDKFIKFCEYIMSSPNNYVILGGDLFENATRTSVSDTFDTRFRPREAKRKIVEIMKPLTPRIITGVDGNHEKRNKKDSDNLIIYDVMCELGLEELYRESASYIKIQIGDTKGAGLSNPTYTVVAHHGAGTTPMKAERFGQAHDNLDVLMVGHTHAPMVKPVEKIRIDTHNNKISTRTWWLMVVTAWLRYGGYALDKLYPPAPYCVQRVELSGDKKMITAVQQA